MIEISMTINFILYFAILYGIYLLFYDTLNRFFKDIKRYFYKKKKETIIQKYLKNVFLSVSDSCNDYEIQVKIYRLYWQTLLIFISFFLVVFIFNYKGKNALYSIAYGIFPSIIISSIPLVRLIIKLYETRRKSSYEATIVVNEVFNQYRVKNYNMLEAIDEAIINLKKDVICKRYLMRLSMRLREYRTDKQLVEIFDEFIFSINTNWAKMLADTMIFSLINKIDVSLSLSGIVEKLGAIDEAQSAGKKYNNEGFVLGKYIAPLMYLAMFIICNKLFGISIKDYLHIQFSGQGLKFFIIIITLFLVCVLSEFVYKRRKFDF